jgi:hypothetical protein
MAKLRGLYSPRLTILDSHSGLRVFLHPVVPLVLVVGEKRGGCGFGESGCDGKPAWSTPDDENVVGGYLRLVTHSEDKYLEGDQKCGGYMYEVWGGPVMAIS